MQQWARSIIYTVCSSMAYPDAFLTKSKNYCGSSKPLHCSWQMMKANLLLL